MSQQTIASQDLEDRIKSVSSKKWKWAFFATLFGAITSTYASYEAAVPHETPMEKVLPFFIAGAIACFYLTIKNGTYWYLSRKLTRKTKYAAGEQSDYNKQLI